MKVLVFHNRYQQRGGEDTVVEAEYDLLRASGHHVEVVEVSNDDIKSLPQKVKAFINTPFDPGRAEWAREITLKINPNVVHVHNFFPLLTPALHVGIDSTDTAIVQTLHNYRLICANGLLLRNGKVCEKCIDGNKGWAVAHRCYRNSAIGSLALARMQWRAKAKSTWDCVDQFIALTNFSKSKFVQSGLNSDRIAVKSNFTADAALEGCGERNGAIYVGRLSPEKGVDILLQAWKEIGDINLTIIGDGPELEKLKSIAPSNVAFTGRLSSGEVHRAMQSAAFMVIPSIWYEGFPMNIVEAFSTGLPVLASRIGSLTEIITPGHNGLLFEAGNVEQLRSIVHQALQGDTLRICSAGAKADHHNKYSAQKNIAELEDIYRAAISNRRERPARAPLR